MPRCLLALLVFSAGNSSTFAMRAAHLPRAASISHLSHHNAYMSQIIYPNQQILMNHEDWHNRKCQPSMSSHNMATPSSTTTTISVIPIPATTTSALISSSEISRTISTTSNVSNTIRAALAMHAPQQHAPAGGTWDNLTDAACISALTHVKAQENPSSMAPCYNIRTLIAETGIFEADLRIYQISLMTGYWKGIESKDMSVGVLFSNTHVERRPDNQVHKRDDRGLEDLWTGQGGSGWGAMRRASSMKPRRIGSLHLHGTLDTLSNRTLQETLAPSIRLSAFTDNGTALTADLTGTEGFFVAGVFAPSLPDKPAVAVEMWPPDIRSIIREGNRIERSQVLPLVVGCVFAVVPAVVEGWGIWVRWRCGREWRASMKRGEGNGVVVVNYY